jgi:hypothetical protein
MEENNIIPDKGDVVCGYWVRFRGWLPWKTGVHHGLEIYFYQQKSLPSSKEGVGQCFIKTSIPLTLVSGCVWNGSSNSARNEAGNTKDQSSSLID